MNKYLLLLTMLTAALVVQAETLQGRVTKAGQMYMLNRHEPGKEKVAVANVAYEHRNALAAYEGKVVKVTGTLQADAKFATFETVDSIEIVEE